jgi:hypothetical protein
MTDTSELFVLPVIQDPHAVSVERNERILLVSISIRSEGTASASHYLISINNPISPAAPVDDYMPHALVGDVADPAWRATQGTAAERPFDCVSVGQVSFELNRMYDCIRRQFREFVFTLHFRWSYFIREPRSALKSWRLYVVCAINLACLGER